MAVHVSMTRDKYNIKGFFDFTITSNSPNPRMAELGKYGAPVSHQEFLRAASDDREAWINKVYGDEGLSSEHYPGTSFYSHSNSDPWVIQIAASDHSVEGNKTWVSPFVLRDQEALIKALRAESIGEAIAVRLMSDLMKAEEITQPEAEQFMQENFGRGKASCRLMFQKAQALEAATAVGM